MCRAAAAKGDRGAAAGGAAAAVAAHRSFLSFLERHVLMAHILCLQALLVAAKYAAPQTLNPKLNPAVLQRCSPRYCSGAGLRNEGAVSS